MRIIFMGTPDFAVPSLRVLVENHYDVLAVVTQVDKPAGRGHATKAPPAKEYAIAHNIPVIQPVKLSKQGEIIEQLKAMKPDLFVTCAFGQILSQAVLDIPRLGTINVHGSLLPRYRGAAPIQWAVINGEKETGITTMFTDIGVDTGDMLLKASCEIPDDMTAGELHDVLSLLGAKVLLNTIQALEKGTLKPAKQDDALATHAPRMTKEIGCIHWEDQAVRIHNLVRGTTPWPGAYTVFNGMKMRIWKTRVDTEPLSSHTARSLPGTILALDAGGMLVQTGDGTIRVLEIQFESGKRMTPWEYSRGHSLSVGHTFGGNL
jgi:methionyl-tRNA formyltransferase